MMCDAMILDLILDLTATVHAGSDVLIVIFTGALVLVGAIQVVAMFRQERWMREAVKVSDAATNAAKASADAATQSAQIANATLKANRNAVRKQLRARVFVESAKRKGVSGPGLFSVEVTIRNFGYVPAYRCTFQTAIMLSPNPLGQNKFPAVRMSGQEPRFVLPHGAETKTTVALMAGTFAQKQHDLLMSGSWSVYLYGRIEYRDGFNRSKHTDFLMRCTGTDYNSGTFTYCETGNGAT
jgi:hypothetical protein